MREGASPSLRRPCSRPARADPGRFELFEKVHELEIREKLVRRVIGEKVKNGNVDIFHFLHVMF